jgi:multiple sugar transport system substrate-binding protein
MIRPIPAPRPLPRVAAVAAAAAVATALAGCGGGSGTPNGVNTASLRPTARTATITVDDVNGAKASPACAAKVKTLRMTAINTLSDVAKSAAAYMEKAHPGLKVELALTAGSAGEVEQQVAADTAAGRVTDVAVAGFDQLRSFVPLGAQEIPARLLRASYDQRYLPMGQIDGKQYGIPEQVSIPVMAYNADLLQQAGVDPASLGTTDGLVAAGQKIKAKFPSIKPIDFPTGGFGQWFLNTIAHSAGGGIQASGGGPALTSTPVENAAGVFKQIGALGPQTANSVQALLPFAAGKTAIIGASIATVSGGLSAIANGSIGKPFKVGVLPLPVLPGGTQRPVGGGNALVVLSKDSCQREMADEFVVALLSPDAVTAASQSVSYLPVDTVAATRLASLYAKYPDLGALNKLIPSIVPSPSWPGARGADAPDTISDAIVRIEKGEDVTKTLAATQKTVEGYTK